MSKTCNRKDCQQKNPQPVENFSESRLYRDGRCGMCKDCYHRSYAKAKRRGPCTKPYSLWTIKQERQFVDDYQMMTLPQLMIKYNKSRASIKKKARELKMLKIDGIQIKHNKNDIETQLKEEPGVFIAINIVSQKKYIGSSNNLKQTLKRIYNHTGCREFVEDLEANEDNFKFGVLCYCAQYEDMAEYYRKGRTDLYCYTVSKALPSITADRLKQVVEANSDKNSENTCWLWTGNRDDDGYGRLKIDGKTYKAHRLSYQAYKGKFEPSFKVCHTCDNPPCVNPDHLFLGSTENNVRDSLAKGRRNKYNLTWEKVREIRHRWATTRLTLKELQVIYGFSVSTIVQNRIWYDENYTPPNKKPGPKE